MANVLIRLIKSDRADVLGQMVRFAISEPDYLNFKDELIDGFA